MQIHGLRNSQRSSLRIGSFATSRRCGKNPSYCITRRTTSQKARSTDDSDPEGDGFLASSTEFIDSLLEKQKKNLQKQAETDESLQLQLEAMRASNAPKFAISVIEWLVGLNRSLWENEVKRLKELEADRDKFVAEWKEFEQKTDTMDPLEIDNLMGQVATGEDASLQATSIVISAFVSATLLSWGSTFFGVSVATLLPDPSVPSASDLSTWAMWTLPYVGATAAAGAILGFHWIGNRGTFRFLADDSFFGTLHPTAVLSLSSALAYSQAIAYQGVWLLFFLHLYRGEGTRFSLDPAAADEAVVQQAMGSLVAAPKILILIAGPAAVVSAAAVEAGYFLVKESINGAVQGIFQKGNGIAVLDPENGFQVLEKYNVDGIGDHEEKRIIIGGTIGDRSPLKVPPEVPSLAKLEMSTQEFWLTASRVFLASMWMGAETLVTGNLWMAAGTGAVGMAVGMGASRQRAREAGLGDD
jgi:hypothetical protein